jgi:hypothetical protein
MGIKLHIGMPSNIQLKFPTFCKKKLVLYLLAQMIALFVNEV